MKILLLFIISTIFILSLSNTSFAADAPKRKLKSSLTMEETKIEGEVEKPEFISIIQRRRVEFKKKGELNISFKDKIFKSIEKKTFENNYSRKFNKVLDTGSVTAK